MCGSIRAYEESVRALAKRRLKEIAEQTAAMYGGNAEVIFLSELPATVNDYEVGDEMFEYAKELVGEKMTMMLPQIMGSEDFSEVLKEVPGVLFRISLGDKPVSYTHLDVYKRQASTSSTSIPRAATSVATRISVLPLRNPCMTRSRCSCFMSP